MKCMNARLDPGGVNARLDPGGVNARLDPGGAMRLGEEGAKPKRIRYKPISR